MTKDPELALLKMETEELERKAEDIEAFAFHFKRMAQTLGKSPSRQLKWLVSFLHSDLTLLKEEKRLALRCELKYLASYGTSHLTKRPPIPSGEKPFDFSLCRLNHFTRVLPNNAFLERCQKDFSQKIPAFLEQHHAQFDLLLLSDSTRTIHVWKKPGGKSGFYLECSMGEDSLKWWVASLLADQGNKLRQCLQCKEIFIAHRKDKKFCSDAHRALSHMRGLRGTPPDRYGKRGRPKKNNCREGKAGE